MFTEFPAAFDPALALLTFGLPAMPAAAQAVASRSSTSSFGFDDAIDIGVDTGRGGRFVRKRLVAGLIEQARAT